MVIYGTKHNSWKHKQKSDSLIITQRHWLSKEDWGKMKLTEAGGQELERQKNSWQRKEHARLQIVCGLEKSPE